MLGDGGEVLSHRAIVLVAFLLELFCPAFRIAGERYLLAASQSCRASGYITAPGRLVDCRRFCLSPLYFCSSTCLPGP